MATETSDSTYNGWAVIHKAMLKKDDGRNLHIIEVHLQKGSNGNDCATQGNTITCCGLEIKPATDFGTCLSRKEDQDSFRISLAKWQNKGYELCGRCVGHFYKDPPKN